MDCFTTAPVTAACRGSTLMQSNRSCTALEAAPRPASEVTLWLEYRWHAGLKGMLLALPHEDRAQPVQQPVQGQANRAGRRDCVVHECLPLALQAWGGGQLASEEDLKLMGAMCSPRARLLGEPGDGDGLLLPAPCVPWSASSLGVRLQQGEGPQSKPV